MKNNQLLVNVSILGEVTIVFNRDKKFYSLIDQGLAQVVTLLKQNKEDIGKVFISVPKSEYNNYVLDWAATSIDKNVYDNCEIIITARE